MLKSTDQFNMGQLPRVARTAYFVYLAVTLLVLIAMKVSLISFGTQLTDALMFIIYIIICSLASLLYIVSTKVSDKKGVRVLHAITIVICVLVCLHYFVEMKFSPSYPG